ncbi:MAG: hypothetical protein JXR37_14115 [Kiritimatiellae bacterium]|nr:hypothetical protein [Kiritimatiellia bacterium]
MNREPMRIQCCVCGRIRIEDEWRLVAAEAETRHSHGYCPDCYEKTMTELAARLSGKTLQMAS